MKNKRKIFIFGILVILFFTLMVFKNVVLAQSVSPTETTEVVKPTQTPAIINGDDELSAYETKIDSLEYLIQSQTASYNATISRWESNLDLILVGIGIIGVFVALLGFGFVKEFINKTVTNQLKNITQEQIDKVISREIIEIRKKYDPMFAELYDEYKKSVKK